MRVQDVTSEAMDGRSSITGAMEWMFSLSFVLSLLLAWIPFIGPFIGPVVGGYVGGRRAGTVGRALLAAVLPAVLMSLLILGAGAGAAAYIHTPVVGAIAAFIAGAVGIILFVHNLLLFVAALVGGLTRQMQKA